MAEGTFCDFPGQMDNSILSQMAAFATRQNPESLGDGQSKGAGFYMEQFPSGLPTTTMEGLGLMGSMNGQTGQGHDPGAMPSSASQQAMFEHMMNFALKPEKGLPPTPPGSPEDQKDAPIMHQNVHQSGYQGNMHPASMVAMPSSINHNLLAKPVPMRRLSEKRIAQARASLGSHAPVNPLPIDELSIDQTFSVGGEMGIGTPALARAIAAVQHTQKRPRSEKKAIAEDCKDGKYFERRKRNNNAAKKSRDCRKAREDEIAIRASFLEKENAILRAQVATLREEANSLRQMLLQKRSARH